MPFVANDLITSAWANLVTEKPTAPAAPTITRFGGVTGTPALSVASVTERTPTTVGFSILYTITPGAAGDGQYQLSSIPSGWTLQAFSVGAFDATGKPAVSALIDITNGFSVTYPNTNAHRLLARVILAKQ